MSKQTIQKISIIGGGNVATHLGRYLYEKGYTIVQLIVRSEKEEYLSLAQQWQAKLCTDYAKIEASVDLILIAVSDDAIGNVAQSIQAQTHLNNILLAHTSGATPMSILSPYALRYGVFYPLQTFSKQRYVDMHTVPLCIDAAKEEDKAALMALGEDLSQAVAYINDEQRAYLHVGAVLVNNFTNHLFALAQNFTAKHHTPFFMLKPLIQETIDKLDTMSAKAAQTGPAKRNDKATIQRHLDLIGEDEDLAQVYKILSQSIAKYHLS